MTTGINNLDMIRICTQPTAAAAWLQRYQSQRPLLACVLGFTATGLIPNISAAGATPQDREYTAIADAEFLLNGPQPAPIRPLPPLQAGASPALISRAVVANQQIPVHLFNAGLCHPPTVDCMDLGGSPARCLSSGDALDLDLAMQLFEQGWHWGKQLARQVPHSYIVLAECVVGGTTTALAVLAALGISAWSKVNSSHVVCNHQQKQAIVQQGLRLAQQRWSHDLNHPIDRSISQQKIKHFGDSHREIWHADAQAARPPDALSIAAAIGDPMQIAAAGMMLSASQIGGVLLAGGTQMLAVYALAQAIARDRKLTWQPQQVVVGTTRWVVDDASGDTVGLAQLVGTVPLLAANLNFCQSRHPQLRAYEQGYVKEGVGAGGCAIAASLYRGWTPAQLQKAVDELIDQQIQAMPSSLARQQSKRSKS